MIPHINITKSPPHHGTLCQDTIQSTLFNSHTAAVILGARGFSCVISGHGHVSIVTQFETRPTIGLRPSSHEIVPRENHWHPGHACEEGASKISCWYSPNKQVIGNIIQMASVLEPWACSTEFKR